MNINLSLTSVINSDAKIKLITLLYKHPSASMSGSELAKIIGVSSMTVSRLLKEFETVNLINIRRVGAAYMCQLNTKSYAFQALKPAIDGLLSIPSPVEHIKKTIASGLPKDLINKIYLYGSIAKDDAEPASDIDIIVIAKNQISAGKLQAKIEELTLVCLDLYGMRLDARVIGSEKEMTKNTPDGMVQIYPL